MRNDGIVNVQELAKAIDVLKPNGELFEIRIIGGQAPLSGYFKDADTLIDALEKVDLRNVNVYMTLNQVNDACFSRVQSERFLKGKNSTQDTEIDGYRYLFIDLDPKRPTGVSSSESEYKAACKVAGKVERYLADIGFEKPVKAVSGNGAHLLYRINLKNTSENQKLVERCLKALSMMFSEDGVEVDTANFNPSRICKLYGTLAQKGASTKERPHRMSRIFDCPKELMVTDRAYLEKLAEEYPEEVTRRRSYSSQGEFDIDDWLSRNGLRFKESSWRDGCRKLVLDNCPFDRNHKAPDSMILIQSNGAIGFKCLHNSCRGKTWQDVRLMYEPDAYDRNLDDERIEAGWKRHNAEKKINYDKPVIEEDGEPEPVFQTIGMILAKNNNDDDDDYIETGITIIDKKMRGLKKKFISCISGLRGSAKSTFLSQICLNAVDNGQRVICYSGELSDKNFAKWMMLQASGKNQVIKSDRFENFYYVKDENKQPIAEWLGNKFWLYNNKYGNDFAQIRDRLVQAIKDHKADLVILDNLMAMSIESIDKDKYEAQTKFVQTLKNIAELYNVHIIFVAHPRKAMGFLRLDDVAGTGNLTNYVDNAFIVHRNNNDFQRLTHQMFGWKDDNDVYRGTNVIEICKDRDNGNLDEFIPLYYEVETKRLKNTPTEYRHYGWYDGFNQIDDHINIEY